MKLCIISNQRSNLSELLSQSFDEVHFLTMEEAAFADLDGYDSFAYLCGTDRESHTLRQDTRNAIEKQLRAGKRFFSEYCKQIGTLRSYNNVSTRFERPVAITESPLLGKVPLRTIFDEQSNDRIEYLNPTGTPILHYYKNPFGFYRVPESKELLLDGTKYALFFETETHLVCSFRLCNFAKASFAPQHIWCQLIAEIVCWLGGDCTPNDVKFYFDAAYHLGGESNTVEIAIKRGLAWFENADMILWKNGMPYGVKEGLSAHVYANGTHGVLNPPRADCNGEMSIAYYLRWLMTGDKRMLLYSDGLMRGVTDLQVKTPGPFYGMMRWTQESWYCCYPDDAARALLIPGTLRAVFGGDRTYLHAVKECLDFIISVTGKNGVPSSRMDFQREDTDLLSFCSYVKQGKGEDMKWCMVGNGVATREEIRNTEFASPSAHYQAYSAAGMLLYYYVTKEKKYLDVGIKAIEHIMATYPITGREHSEVQEYCRLMLPLAILWIVSEDLENPKPEYKEWLYRVAGDLNKYRHPRGGFREWDTGYKAACAGVADGESSVLAENGDPITDLIYSVNWLPTSLSLAYMFTKDEYFREMRDYTIDFLCCSQVCSDNKMIDGIWARALDLDLQEVYGVPNDIGWSPWSVETGWTMGEIITGLELSLLQDKVK